MKNFSILVLTTGLFLTGNLFSQGHKPLAPSAGAASGPLQKQISDINIYLQSVHQRLGNLEAKVAQLQTGTGGIGTENAPLGFRLILCLIGGSLYGNNCYGPEFRYTLNFLVVKSKSQWDLNLVQCRNLIRQKFGHYTDSIQSIGVTGATYIPAQSKFTGVGADASQSAIESKSIELCNLISDMVKQNIEKNHTPEPIWEAVP